MRVLTLLWVVCGAAVAVASADDVGWTGSRITRDGVTTIDNPSEPVFPLKEIPCRELWRVSGDEELAGGLLGFVLDVDVDAAGNTYLLDTSLSRVHIFDPSGTWLRTIGREGEGPGEFARAERFALLPNGDLGVLQPLSAKVVGIAPDGQPAPNVAFRTNEGFQFIYSLDASGDRVVVDLSETVQIDGERHIAQTLATCDRMGTIQSTVLSRSIKAVDQGIAADAEGIGSFMENWSVSADGRIFVTRRPHQYCIEVFDLEGALQQVIRRQYTPVKLAADELAEEKERVERLKSMTRGSGIDFEVDPYKHDIEATYPRPGGDLWVATSRGALERPPGAIGVLDVFDADGRFLTQVRLPVDYDPERDSFELIGDRLYVMKESQMRPSFVSESSAMTLYFDNDKLEDDDQEEEAPPLEVICYQVMD